MYKNRNWKSIIAFTLFGVTIISGSTFYYFHLHNNETLAEMNRKHRRLKNKLKEILHHTKQKAHEDGNASLQSSSANWLSIQKKVKDTVVQVFSHISEYNWLEPYKTPRQGEATGSAFFINERGDIITNYHVVAQSSSVHIQIPSFGMEQFEAKVIGASPERDIALLQLTQKSLEKIHAQLPVIPYLELGDSDEILRSQEVLALGYPLGQARLKSTLGIVSGRERLGYFGYIQVTSPLNPGNSGGPALDATGKVIGINAAGVLEAQSVGYIIPVNEVKTAINDLRTVPLLRKPTLGCIFTVATSEMVDYFKNPQQGGWYIAKVFENTLLESVGIQKDDMLYEVNGHKIDMYGEMNVPWSEDKVSLFELLNRYTIGDTLSFLIYRKGKPVDFTFKLEHKYLPPIRTIYTEFEKEHLDYEIIGGMVVMPLTLNHVGQLLQHVPSLVKYARPENQQEPALLITHIFPNSQAYKARVLRPGEIIDKINDIEVKTLADFRNAILESKGQPYLTVRTTDNLYAVLSKDEILEDESTLAERYFYKQSKLAQALQENHVKTT